ncbi:MAG: exodeoxyribonuclease V subunit gamma [Lachnospiraceae bacterium]|nr:exodeoxyribonuclease V subunit gamma [Lachnospiraceae bacterium]
MSLQFITGSSGSGKSTYLYQQMIEESIADPGRFFLVIVPEQFTMSTQRQLVELHPRHGLMNVEILSFERLAYRVFDELGISTASVLEETGKNLVVRRVARKLADELPTLGHNMNKKGFVSQVKSLISELSQYHIGCEEFEEMIATPGMSKSFYQKGRDLLRLYQGFLDFIDGSYITSEQLLELLMDHVEESLFVRDSILVLDGFTGFTPVQQQLLLRLFPLTAEIRCAITIDPAEALLSKPAEEELFAMSKKMAASLVKMAQMTGVDVLDPVVLAMDETSRYPTDHALKHLEANLFRVEKTQREDASGIHLVRAMDPKEELAYAAATIQQLLRKEDVAYRYQDFALVCARMEDYSPYIDDIFRDYEIPLFKDEKAVIQLQPAIEFVRSAIHVVTDRFSYDAMLHFFRCGLTGLTSEEIDQMDNYLYQSGIRGKNKWMHPFMVCPHGFDGEALVVINDMRSFIMEKAGGFFDAFAKKQMDVRSRATALYELLVAFDVETQLHDFASDYEAAGDEKKAREYQDIYGIVIGILDKMVALMGEEVLDAGQFLELFESGVETARIGMIPPDSDSVVFGDMERTRLQDIKVLFLLGANEGAIPKAVSGGNMFSQSERLLLKEASYELAPTDQEKAFMQRFYLYLTLTKPKDALYVSYAKISNNGESLQKSYLISVLTELFPKLHPVDAKADQRIWREAKSLAKDYCIDLMRRFVAREELTEAQIREMDALFCVFYLGEEEEMQQILDGIFYHHENEKISAGVMKALSNGRIQGSVSRLETYAGCAYRYFLQYLLGLSERREHAFEAVDMGSLYHDALEKYERGVAEAGEDWQTITPERSKEILQESIARAYEEMEKVESFDSARENYIRTHMEQTLERTVWALTKQVRQGSFTPRSFELPLGELAEGGKLVYPLENTMELQLNGVIDRIDDFTVDDTLYVKVIDYKSSAKDIRPGDLYYGLQIQLIFYLNAVMEAKAKQNTKVAPAAVLYYHIDDPLIPTSYGVADEPLEQSILEELKVKGLVNDNAVVLEALDQEIYATKKSSVIPVELKKDNTTNARSKVASEEEFGLLCRYVQKKVVDIGNAIARGEIAAEPYARKDRNGCTYCEYHSICGFDARMEGFSYRRLGELKADEAYARMKEELD